MVLFRSETMLHKTIRIPIPSRHEVMAVLGSIENSVEFVDLNKDEIETKKPFNQMISRCDEIENIFLKFELLLNERDIPFPQYNNFDLFNTHLTQDMRERDKRFGSTYFDLIESEVMEDHRKFKEHIRLSEDSKFDYIHLLEEKIILDKLDYMFNSGTIKQMESNIMISSKSKHKQFVPSLNTDNKNIIDANSINDYDQASVSFLGTLGIKYISGICNSEDEIRIKRMIFRAGHSRAFPLFFNSRDLDTRIKAYLKTNKERKVFIIVCQEGEVLLRKIDNILNLFNCHIYQVPNPNDIKRLLISTQRELESKEKLIRTSELSFINEIKSKVEQHNNIISLYALYRTFFKRERLIYTTLNKCNVSESLVTGEVWIPEDKYELIQHKLKQLEEQNEQFLPTTFSDIISTNNTNVPPTFFKCNDFIYPFQEVVQTYGVPRYKEVNPTLFNIISFPFLFGIMFGDIGHGSLLLLLALYICINKNAIINSDSILKNAIQFRYILLLMGIFSLYCGLMYNDFMSLPISLFDSCYVTDALTQTTIKKDKCTYPFGLDPKWYSASNDLAFMNSFKMKWSVIIGVLQMTMGLVLKGMNDLYFNDIISFVFEFIPQLIFMLSLFGYMIMLIYIKWFVNWDADLQQAPSIINTLMSMALKGGSVDGKPVWGSVVVEERTNKVLFYVAIMCVPFILIPKPLIKVYRMYYSVKEDEDDKKGEHDEDGYEPLLKDVKGSERNKKQHQHHQESIADICVHQCIHTIEYVLSCVSNTASYLRLWALSLAHAQLSKVFFEKAILGLAKDGSVILVIIGFFVFAHVTVFVLMGMDLMESFLHTLRLHWVEFQDKFYSADGVKYSPFCFKAMIEGEY